jgi:hypothetical protein
MELQALPALIVLEFNHKAKLSLHRSRALRAPVS